MNNSKYSNNRDFLTSDDLNKSEILSIFELTAKFKKGNYEKSFDNKVLGLVFDKASTRTRVSFQVAMSRLGGSTIDLNPQSSQIERGEPIRDTARVLSRYCDILAIRTFKQSTLEEYAHWSSIPVINALTDLEHPCQALADFYTIKEEFGDFENIVLTFIGDGNNVANSLIMFSAILGVKIRILCPKGFEPSTKILTRAKEISNDLDLIITDDLNKALDGANVLYTDVWSSMGQEKDKSTKDNHFKGFTLGKEMINKVENKAIIMHCLPAYRGKEITDEAFESTKSRIFEQAENRMHVQQGLLSYLLN
tara:strand:- start:154 stop:1077 length:924 start_codon:yes stop_codon:yes gene_type:complete